MFVDKRESKITKGIFDLINTKINFKRYGKKKSIKK